MANKFTRSLTELVNQLNDPRTIDSLAVNDKTALSPNTFSLKVNPVAKALTNWDLVKEEATTTQPPKKTIANDLTVFSAVQTATEKYPVRIITNDNPSIDLKTISETTFIWASKKDTTLRLFDRINNLRTGRDLGRAVGREAINVLSSGIAIIRYAQKSFSYDAGNSIISIEGESISLLNNVINEYVREQEEIRVASIAPATETLAGTTSEVLADDLNTRLTQAEADIDANEASILQLDELKAPLASPALTGTPTAPTPPSGSSDTRIATTEYISDSFGSIQIIGNEISTTDSSGIVIAEALTALSSLTVDDDIIIKGGIVYPDEKVRIGTAAGAFNQGNEAIALGYLAGETSQSSYSISIGERAGRTNQGDSSIAIGSAAGRLNQAQASIAIGIGAGAVSQGQLSIAIGDSAGNASQGEYAVAVGISAGAEGQSDFSIAVGYGAGRTNQGESSIAIGTNAGFSSQHANSIILNASGSNLNSDGTGRFFVKPVREVETGGSPAGFYQPYYNPVSGEFIYLSGIVNFQTVSQTVVPLTGATGVVTHNLSNGAVFFHSSISANFTANFTNVPTDNDRGIGVALILNQGGTGYLPTAVQIDGASVTLRWAYNTVPTPSSSQIDTVSFTLIRTGATWYVIGQHTNFA